jgi:hypothetical protein
MQRPARAPVSSPVNRCGSGGGGGGAAFRAINTAGFPLSPAVPANLRFMRAHHRTPNTADMQSTAEVSGTPTIRTAEIVHPSVVAFNKPWNGYKYWMCTTPYPGSSEGQENPTIIATNDDNLVDWEEPAGISNPVHLRPAGVVPQGDPCMIYDPVQNTLVMVYINTLSSGSVRRTYLSKSTDGITWSTPLQIFSGPNVSSPNLVTYKDSGVQKYRLIYEIGDVSYPQTLHWREISEDVMNASAWASSTQNNVTLSLPSGRGLWDFFCYRLQSGVYLFFQTMINPSVVQFTNHIGYSSDDLATLTVYARPYWQPRMGGWPQELSYTTACVRTGAISRAMLTGRGTGGVWGYSSCPLLPHPWLAMSSFSRDWNQATGAVSSHGQKSFEYTASGSGTLDADDDNGLSVPAGKLLTGSVAGMSDNPYTAIVQFRVPTVYTSVAVNTYVEICNVAGIRIGLKRHTSGSGWLLEFRRADTNAPVYQPAFLSGEPWMRVAIARQGANFYIACNPHHPGGNAGITNLANSQTNDLTIGSTGNIVGFELRQLEVLPDASSEITSKQDVKMLVDDDPYPQTDIVAAVPTIAVQPNSEVANDPDIVFSCYSYGYPGPSYQWQEKSPSGAWTNVGGATSETYTRDLTALVDWRFRCLVSNISGQVISAESIVIEPVP